MPSLAAVVTNDGSKAAAFQQIFSQFIETEGAWQKRRGAHGATAAPSSAWEALFTATPDAAAVALELTNEVGVAQYFQNHGADRGRKELVFRQDVSRKQIVQTANLALEALGNM